MFNRPGLLGSDRSFLLMSLYFNMILYIRIHVYVNDYSTIVILFKYFYFLLGSLKKIFLFWYYYYSYVSSSAEKHLFLNPFRSYTRFFAETFPVSLSPRFPPLSLTCTSLRIVYSLFYYTQRWSRLVITTWLLLPCTLYYLLFGLYTPTVHVILYVYLNGSKQLKIIFAIWICNNKYLRHLIKSSYFILQIFYGYFVRVSISSQLRAINVINKKLLSSIKNNFKNV